MKYCTRCGKPLDDNAVICPYCGHPAGPVRRQNGTLPYLIWSIILIVLCNPVASILGIVALVETLTVHPSTAPAEAEQKLRTARVLCIVATCIDAAALVVGAVALPFSWNFRWGF